MSLQARYLWAYLPCYADREGRLEDRPLMLKGEVFPADAVDVSALLDEMAVSERGFIIRYRSVSGKRLIQIVNFSRYQRPHHRERPSTLPPPDGWEDVGQSPGKSSSIDEESDNGPGESPSYREGSDISRSGSPDLRISGSLDPHISPKVAKKKRKRAATAEGSPAFEAFWEAYPAHRRNLGKPAAISKWPGDEHAKAIMEHLEAAKASQDWQKEGGEYVLGMRRYLNDAAWMTPVSERKQTAQQPTLRWATPEVD